MRGGVMHDFLQHEQKQKAALYPLPFIILNSTSSSSLLLQTRPSFPLLISLKFLYFPPTSFLFFLSSLNLHGLKWCESTKKTYIFKKKMKRSTLSKSFFENGRQWISFFSDRIVQRNRASSMIIIVIIFNIPLKLSTWYRHTKNYQIMQKNLEIGVLTKLIVTARIRGNVLLRNIFLHI